MVRTAVSFTGGKDCCLALHKAPGKVVCLVVFHPPNPSFRAHKIAWQKQQAAAMLLPLHFYCIEAIDGDYRLAYARAVGKLIEEHAIKCLVTGDIDLIGSSTSNFITSVCHEHHPQLEVASPLWQQPRRQLLQELIDLEFEAVISCCKTPLDASFIGRRIDMAAVQEFERLGIDLTGENGEYHTMVVNGPIFRQRLQLINLQVQELKNQPGQPGEQWWVFGEQTSLGKINGGS